jgi:hypothetical protein
MEKKKNCWVIPTDKPSRLIYNDANQLCYHSNKSYKNDRKWMHRKKFNIYITNNEVIKDGEYGICLNLVREGFKSHQAVFKMDAEQRQAMEELGGQKKAEVLKIILTTDKDLIADGVQSIPDEFLEWFVNNPSCEFVGTELVEFEVDMGLGESCIEYGDYYKIIIPKEEPKQEPTIVRLPTYYEPKQESFVERMKPLQEQWQQDMDKELMKKETLEEAAENYVDSFEYGIAHPRRVAIKSFINGAKWQQEQIGKSEFLQKLRATLSDAEARRLIFKQFKNK